jgi:uncharacterized protein YjbI with pentapeptide repeats
MAGGVRAGRLRPQLAAALVVGAYSLIGAPALAASPEAVVRLLDQKRCKACALQQADLVQAQLGQADLRQAQLQRANLSGAMLDGANLSGADLSHTSLHGASLRGADLRGSQLLGSDLRESDLQGALLDPGALSRAHWQGARGLDSIALSYAELHNAGASAAQAGRYPEAETWFNEAIRRNPEAAISWLARGLSRTEQGKKNLAAQDLAYAGQLYGAMGDTALAEELKQASQALLQNPKGPKAGNGAGSALLGGAAAAFKVLAPIAVKAFMPVGI